MATLITITNVSHQSIPILVDSIDADVANDNSDISHSVASQMTIAPSAQLVVERQRIDTAQLEQLRRKNLITYT